MIIGHVSPDWDCIGALWLLKRYGGMADEEIVLVNTGDPDNPLLNKATAVVDTGRIFNPAWRRFDHHHFLGTAANETCATLQVAQWLVLHRPDFDFNPIWPLVNLIYFGDTGRPEANESRQRGIHALLSAKKAAKWTDDALLIYGFELLDTLTASLFAQDTARGSLAQHTVYRSDDGLLIALRDAPYGATFAAHEAGARLVVFSNYEKNSIGVMRGGEGTDVHCGGLVSSLLNDYDCGLDDISAALFDELAIWYRHQAGFYAGRGSDKAPSDKPILVDVADAARAIDRAWNR